MIAFDSIISNFLLSTLHDLLQNDGTKRHHFHRERITVLTALMILIYGTTLIAVLNTWARTLNSIIHAKTADEAGLRPYPI